MKPEEKEFRKSLGKFKATVKDVPCSMKYQLYWNLLKGCLNKDYTAVKFVNEKWYRFTMNRVKIMKKRLSIK